MKVEVHRRIQGTPTKEFLWRGEMDVIPRVGEWLALSGDDAADVVQDVLWVIYPLCVHIEVQ